MHSSASPSVEISIALLSWINEQLRESAEESAPRPFNLAEWLQPVATALAIGLSGLCMVALQRWS